MSELDFSVSVKEILDTVRRALRQRPKLSLTQRGSGFCALTLGVGFVALNSGNNLIYLVLGMMLSLILSSGVLSSINLHRVRVKRHPQLRGYAGRPLIVRLGLVNLKKYWPSMGIGVEDPPVDQQSLSAKKERSINHMKGRSMYVFRLKGGTEEQLKYHLTIQSRGVYTLEGARIYTRFPFGFFEKSVGLRLQQSLTIFPRIDAPVSPLLKQALLNDQLGSSLSYQNRNQPVVGLRTSIFESMVSIEPHTVGTPLKFIHWKSSAKRGELMVRRGEQSSSYRFALWINPYYDPDLGTPSKEEQDQYADLIMTICELVWTQGRAIKVNGITGSERILQPTSDGQHTFMHEMAIFMTTPSQSHLNHIPPEYHIVSMSLGLELIDSKIRENRVVHTPVRHDSSSLKNHLTPFSSQSYVQGRDLK